MLYGMERGGVCDLSLKPIELKSYYETVKSFIKLRSNQIMNTPTMNNPFPVVVKNSHFD